jgi:predicted acyltransferase
MIIANFAGSNKPWWLDHAPFYGLTPADLIFPAFMFIMGMVIPLAVTDKKPITKRKVIRIVALFAIGMLFNLI